VERLAAASGAKKKARLHGESVPAKPARRKGIYSFAWTVFIRVGWQGYEFQFPVLRILRLAAAGGLAQSSRNSTCNDLCHLKWNSKSTPKKSS
jgi:hypothetical protein